jgi:hypothetical protein
MTIIDDYEQDLAARQKALLDLINEIDEEAIEPPDKEEFTKYEQEKIDELISNAQPTGKGYTPSTNYTDWAQSVGFDPSGFYGTLDDEK